MFKDASEELERLQAELLAEEEPEEEYEEEETYEEDPWLYEDTAPEGDPVIYQNYSNDYGKELRNYASGYRAYNSDITDEDLEDYSEQVRQGRGSGSFLGVLAILLVLALLAVLLAWWLYERGVLG